MQWIPCAAPSAFSLRQLKVHFQPFLHFHPGFNPYESAYLVDFALSLSVNQHFRPKMTEAQVPNPGLQAFLAFFASQLRLNQRFGRTDIDDFQIRGGNSIDGMLLRFLYIEVGD